MTRVSRVVCQGCKFFKVKCLDFMKDEKLRDCNYSFQLRYDKVVNGNDYNDKIWKKGDQ